MIAARTQSEIEEIARELDLLVFALELKRSKEITEDQERKQVRREIEKLRERLEDLTRGM
jgi:uncharacterized membrane protein